MKVKTTTRKNKEQITSALTAAPLPPPFGYPRPTASRPTATNIQLTASATAISASATTTTAAVSLCDRRSWAHTQCWDTRVARRRCSPGWSFGNTLESTKKHRSGWRLAEPPLLLALFSFDPTLSLPSVPAAEHARSTSHNDLSILLPQHPCTTPHSLVCGSKVQLPAAAIHPNVPRGDCGKQRLEKPKTTPLVAALLELSRTNSHHPH